MAKTRKKRNFHRRQKIKETTRNSKQIATKKHMEAVLTSYFI